MTVGRDLQMTVNVRLPHPGALHQVRAYGPGARELHAAILDVFNRHIPAVAGDRALTEIDAIFERPVDHITLAEALDAAAGAVAIARALVEGKRQ